MTKELSIEDEIKGLLNPVEETNEEEIIEETTEETDDAPEDDKPVVETDKAPEVQEAVIEAPISLSKAAKERWKDLPKEVQEDIVKRESDVHRMMTSQDGELRVGREMKEVIAPYMAIIQSEGGTPAGAVKDLLNTAYVLRTGNPIQKAQLLQQVAEQYGIDMRLAGQQGQQQQVDPMVQQLYNRIHQLEQTANPEVIKNQLQEQMTRDNVTQEVSEFAANPKNVHFNTVRTSMGPLMVSGQAKNLQEAYDMACWADPTIRSTLLSAQKVEQQAKQKKDMEAKRKAAASVNGSPGLASPTDRTPQKSLEDDIRDQLREASGAII